MTFSSVAASGNTIVVEVGVQGIPGANGVDGASATAYTHTQTVPSLAWTIGHNLDRKPSITTSTSDGQVVEGDITYNSSNVAVVTFSTPLSGQAYCI